MLKEDNTKGSVNSQPVFNSKNENADKNTTVVVITGDHMGKGNDELGAVLMKSFFHSLVELEKRPDTIIFYNTGVWLATNKSDIVEDLIKLESMGVEMLICGTCINFFNIADEIGTGKSSNMHEILKRISDAGKLIMP